jgi:hypothetical protein
MKTKKSNIILLAAVAVSFVSCVDDAVSPQVEAIRGQQVEWMKAKTAAEQATADMTRAEIVYKAGALANQTALNNAEVANQNALTAAVIAGTADVTAAAATKLKNDQLAYEVAVENNKTLLKAAEAALANANKALQIALRELAKDAATSGSVLAADYLEEYTDAAIDLAELVEYRVESEANLAAAKLALSSPNMLADFLKKTQDAIDSDVIELAAKEKTLAIFTNAVQENSTKLLSDEVSELEKDNSILIAQNIKFNLAIDKIDLQITPLETEKGVLEGLLAVLLLNPVTPANTLEINSTEDKIEVVVAKIDALEVKIDIEQEKETINLTKISANYDIINVLDTAITDLGENFNGIFMVESTDIKEIIADTKTDIYELKEDIVANKKLLSTNTISNAIAAEKAKETLYTKEISSYNAQISAQEKIVNKWKSLLDSVVL